MGRRCGRCGKGKAGQQGENTFCQVCGASSKRLDRRAATKARKRRHEIKNELRKKTPKPTEEQKKSWIEWLKEKAKRSWIIQTFRMGRSKGIPGRGKKFYRKKKKVRPQKKKKVKKKKSESGRKGHSRLNKIKKNKRGE